MIGKDTYQTHAPTHECRNYPKLLDIRKCRSESTIKSRHENYYPSSASESLIKSYHEHYHPSSASETVQKPLRLLHGMHGSTQPTTKKHEHHEYSSHPDQKKLKSALKKTSELRDRQFSRRLQLKEKRTELRQERDVLGDVDTSFMRSVREFRLRNYMSEDALEDRCRELESQRDVVGSLQYEYDQVEDEHDDAEMKLESEEGKVDALLSSFLKDDSDDEVEGIDTDSSSDGHPMDLKDPTGGKEAQMRRAEYESRTGDARILREKLLELLSEKSERLRHSKMRERLGLEQGESDKAFAEEFDYLYPEILGDLKGVEADVEQLKEELIRAGLWVPEPTWLKNPPETIALQNYSPSSQPQAPVLRERSASDSMTHHLEKISASAKARTGKWMLITIGSSPVERARHKDMLQKLGDGSIDDKEWARLVIETWRGEHDDSSRGSWENISPQDLLEHMPENRLFPSGSSILLSGRLEAQNAMSDFQQRFPSEDHATPYGTEALELDEYSEYESRSI